jgi:hypothetical protein
VNREPRAEPWSPAIHGRVPAEPDEAGRREPTWQGPLVTLGLATGILLMSIQLWLLTLAFNLYLSGERGSVVLAAAISGLVFLGGLGMLLMIDRAPVRRVRRTAPLSPRRD